METIHTIGARRIKNTLKVPSQNIPQKIKLITKNGINPNLILREVFNIFPSIISLECLTHKIKLVNPSTKMIPIIPKHVRSNI